MWWCSRCVKLNIDNQINEPYIYYSFHQWVFWVSLSSEIDLRSTSTFTNFRPSSLIMLAGTFYMIYSHRFITLLENMKTLDHFLERNPRIAFTLTLTPFILLLHSLSSLSFTFTTFSTPSSNFSLPLILSLIIGILLVI